MNRWELSDTDGQTESNGAFGKSDIEGKAARVAARERGTRTSFKCGERDEMDGQPKGRECGMQSSQIILPADLMLYVIHV